MSTQRIATWGGDYHFNTSDTPISDGNYYGFTVCEDDTVVSLMSGGPNGNVPSPATNYITECNLSAKQLKAGTLITIPLGEVIENFDVSAGSVVLHAEFKK